VHRYLIVDIMMNDGEKRRPVFIFYNNASCKRKTEATPNYSKVRRIKKYPQKKGG
jgi:hypothetical protein